MWVVSYSHRLPGRLRIRSTVLKRNPAKASAASTIVGMFPGVQSVDVNSVTGSLLIRHDPDTLDSETLLAMLQQYDFGSCEAPTSTHQRAGSDLSDAAARAITTWFLQRVFEQSLIRLVPGLL